MLNNDHKMNKEWSSLYYELSVGDRLLMRDSEKELIRFVTVSKIKKASLFNTESILLVDDSGRTWTVYPTSSDIGDSKRYQFFPQNSNAYFEYLKYINKCKQVIEFINKDQLSITPEKWDLLYDILFNDNVEVYYK